MSAGRRRQSKWRVERPGPLNVGQCLRLVPFWDRSSMDPNRRNLLIDPGPAFGFGEHPSTIMALEFIEVAAERLSPGYSVLDAGTGTGVLAIAAVSLGAGPVTAFDVDQSAVAVARRNFGLNLEPDGIRPEITLFVGEIAAARGKFDLVLANLAAPLLLRIRDELTAKVGKMLILSGIAEALSAQTLESYAETGLRLKATVSRDGWHAALFE